MSPKKLNFTRNLNLKFSGSLPGFTRIYPDLPVPDRHEKMNRMLIIKRSIYAYTVRCVQIPEHIICVRGAFKTRIVVFNVLCSPSCVLLVTAHLAKNGKTQIKNSNGVCLVKRVIQSMNWHGWFRPQQKKSKQLIRHFQILISFCLSLTIAFALNLILANFS